MGAVTSQNSTIVRTQKKPAPFAFHAAKAGIAVLSPRAPELAARWAEGIFLTARRRKRPAWEAAALAGATRGEVAYEGGVIPTWTWSPEGAASRSEAPPTVLLVHGWEGRGAQLATFVAPLVEQGFRVVTFDAPGHGESTLRHGSFVEHARAALVVADAVGDLHAVIGHSVGGSAALLATRFGLRARRFVILGAPRTPNRFVRGFARMFGLDDAVRRAMIGRLESRYGMSFSDLDVRRDVLELDAPLLVIHDEDDEVVPALDGVALATSARNGKLVPTTGLGHQRMLRAPEVIDRVVDFVGDGSAAPTLAETIDGELFYRDTRW